MIEFVYFAFSTFWLPILLCSIMFSIAFVWVLDAFVAKFGKGIYEE